MSSLFEYESSPAGSLQTLTLEDRLPYFDLLLQLPQSLRSLLFSAKTGAYIRGLVKTAKLPLEQTSSLAFLVLQAGVGKITLTQLPILIEEKLALDTTAARNLAQAIEKDIFSHLTLELNQVQQSTMTAQLPPSIPGGARNVLDLKNQSAPPVPPSLPPRR